MDVIARLDEARRAKNVLEHPFYERWSAGELSAAELSVYAGEYRHAVVALAQASAQAAAAAGAEHRVGLERHAEEEAAHVALWDEFARAARRPRRRTEPERSQTRRVRRHGRRVRMRWSTWRCCMRSRLVSRRSSRTKLDGLIEHYGYAEEGPAVEYFTLHERLDVEHARQAGELIETLLEGRADREAMADRMVARAQAALEGNWELLSGVESVCSPVAVA